MVGASIGVRRVASTSRVVQLRQEEALIAARLEPLLAAWGLHGEHWRIIAVVDDVPGITMTSLADSAVLPPATLTRHVDRLVELGVVVRHVDPADRRRVVLALSPRGAGLAGQLRAAESVADPAAVSTR